QVRGGGLEGGDLVAERHVVRLALDLQRLVGDRAVPVLLDRAVALLDHRPSVLRSCRASERPARLAKMLREERWRGKEGRYRRVSGPAVEPPYRSDRGQRRPARPRRSGPGRVPRGVDPGGW